MECPGTDNSKKKISLNVRFSHGRAHVVLVFSYVILVYVTLDKKRSYRKIRSKRDPAIPVCKRIKRTPWQMYLKEYGSSAG